LDIRTLASTSQITFPLSSGGKKVYLAGEFNHWDTLSLPMKKTRMGFGKVKSNYLLTGMNISFWRQFLGGGYS